MLYLIGLGLNDEKDISIKGLEAIKSCSKVFLENYTSILNNSLPSDLEKFYNKKIILANRNLVETESNKVLTNAKTENIAFLVVGDVFSATTHTDLFQRALKKGIKVEIINNTSIMNAIGITGLQLYKFGKTTSITYPEENFKPETAYDVIKMNKTNKLHTLILLDIKMNEKGFKQRTFMTINEAIKIFKKIEQKRNEKVITKDTKLIGCARLGSTNQTIKAGLIKDLENFDFGKPLHCLIVPAEMHFIEEEMFEYYTK